MTMSSKMTHSIILTKKITLILKIVFCPYIGTLLLNIKKPEF